MATKAKAPRSTASGTAKRRIRKIFGDIHEVVDMPNLIEVQRESYEQFLRKVCVSIMLSLFHEKTGAFRRPYERV